MTHRPTLSVLLAACGCATASPSTEPSLSFVTLMGVSAPERIPGYVAFEAHRMEDAEWGVTFMYTPPLDAEPGIRLRVHPIPDSASATYLRDTFANELEQRARPRRTGPQTRVEPAQAVTVLGHDGVSYDGWRSTAGTPGSRSLSHLYFFEKQGHLVRYSFMDDGLAPVVTQASALAFIESTIGELVIRRPPLEGFTVTPRAPRPAPNPVTRPAPLPPPYDGARDDVREAVARWAFQNADTDLDPPAAYCVASYEEGGAIDADPDAEFLGRFDDLDVPLRPVSECHLLAGGPPQDTLRRHSVVDPASDQFGLYFRLLRVTWTNSTSAEAGVVYQQGLTWGGGWQCRVESTEPDAWQVRECQRTVDF